jgi:hypothetical protein
MQRGWLWALDDACAVQDMAALMAHVATLATRTPRPVHAEALAQLAWQCTYPHSAGANVPPPALPMEPSDTGSDRSTGTHAQDSDAIKGSPLYHSDRSQMFAAAQFSSAQAYHYPHQVPCGPEAYGHYSHMPYGPPPPHAPLGCYMPMQPQYAMPPPSAWPCMPLPPQHQPSVSLHQAALYCGAPQRLESVPPQAPAVQQSAPPGTAPSTHTAPPPPVLPPPAPASLQPSDMSKRPGSTVSDESAKRPSVESPTPVLPSEEPSEATPPADVMSKKPEDTSVATGPALPPLRVRRNVPALSINVKMRSTPRDKSDVPDQYLPSPLPGLLPQLQEQQEQGDVAANQLAKEPEPVAQQVPEQHLDQQLPQSVGRQENVKQPVARKAKAPELASERVSAHAHALQGVKQSSPKPAGATDVTSSVRLAPVGIDTGALLASAKACAQAAVQASALQKAQAPAAEEPVAPPLSKRVADRKAKASIKKQHADRKARMRASGLIDSQPE